VEGVQVLVFFFFFCLKNICHTLPPRYATFWT